MEKEERPFIKNYINDALSGEEKQRYINVILSAVKIMSANLLLPETNFSEFKARKIVGSSGPFIEENGFYIDFSSSSKTMALSFPEEALGKETKIIRAAVEKLLLDPSIPYTLTISPLVSTIAVTIGCLGWRIQYNRKAQND